MLHNNTQFSTLSKIPKNDLAQQRARQQLVEVLAKGGIKNQQVLAAIGSIPRHLFLEPALAHRAYEDRSLPIGFQQTLSRPYTVARMSELLMGAGKVDTVLEVGTGSGYQTSVLAKLLPRVFTIERIELLMDKAQTRLKSMAIHNVLYRHGDGYQGWPEREPFDGIIVTAAPATIPKVLQYQLKNGGCMIIPVGTDQQKLMKITRHGNYFAKETVEGAYFVPLLSGKN